MKNAFDLTGALLVMIFAILIFYGYIMNIIELATAQDATGLVILRTIGIFIVPLGSILGFI